MNCIRAYAFAVAILILSLTALTRADEDPVAHWKLTRDSKDGSAGGHNAVNHGVKFENGSAVFNGVDAWLEVPESKSLKPGTGPFSIAVWVHTAEQLDDVLGDVITCYDPVARTGCTLSLMNYAGVTSAQSNWRNILFGIDAAKRDAQWTDRGRPGTNQYVKSLVVFEGDLYAAVWEPGAGKTGRLYRYAGGTRWVDCGGPDLANSITGLAVFNGKLYAGTELYSGGGSSLPLSPNQNHGGKVFRYEGGTRWTDCGKVADVRSISGLAVYKGKLYAGTGTTGNDHVQARFGYRVAYAPGPDRLTCSRGDVDDVAAALLDHDRGQVLAAQEGTSKVHPHRQVPVPSLKV